MKNITKFDDFKNQKNTNLITEAEGNRDFRTSINDPFVNVAGNFAGADKTLVGSAVIKIFMFVRRKGYQALMNRWLKPSLRKAYLKGLLKYAMINKKMLPKAKVYYQVILIRNEQGEKVEKSNVILVKFILNKNYNFDIDAEISTDKDEKINDGFYKFKDFPTTFKSVGSKVAEIDPNETEEDISKNEIEGNIEETTETDTTETDKGKNLDETDSDIKMLSDQIVSEIEKGEITKEKLTKYLEEINAMLKITQDGLNEIVNILKTETSPDKKTVLETDKLSWEGDIKEINKIKSIIENKLKGMEGAETKTTKPVEPTKPVVPSTRPFVKQNASLETDNNNILLEVQDTTVQTTESPKVQTTEAPTEAPTEEKKESEKYSKEDIDKLTKLSISGVDLNDKDFKDQFNDDETKKAATKVALDYRSEIIKIQLSAERFFINNKKEVDRKLQNSWLKMVQNVKQDFAHYFDIEQLDPQMLRNKLGGDVDKLPASVNKNQQDPLVVVNKIKLGEQIGKNDLIKDILSLSTFKDISKSGLCIIKMNGYGKSINFVCNVEITNSIYVYRIIGTIKDFDGLINVDSPDNLKSFIDKNTDLIPEFFGPKNKKMTDGSKYITTFLIGAGKAATENSNNYVIPIYVYSKKDVKRFDNECILYRHMRTSNTNTVDLVKTDEDVSKLQYKYLRDVVIFSTPILIKPAKYTDMGLNQDDLQFIFKDVMNNENYGKVIKAYLSVK